MDINAKVIDPRWIDVNDRLPEETGFYLVFAPTYSGGSSSGLACIKGVMFSKFTVAKNGTKRWSIEEGYHKRPNCIKYWMPIPSTGTESENLKCLTTR